MLHSFNFNIYIKRLRKLKEVVQMSRLYYGYSRTAPVKGYVIALKCDDKFYVISKKTYERI